MKKATPDPASGSSSHSLNGVSCTSASACTAVGYYYNTSGVYFTLAERWNGTKWAVQTTPNPAGSSQPELQSVSCATASACIAVGYQQNSGGQEVTLAERWNSTTWTVQDTPNPTNVNGSVFSGVSCTSASACTAVGYDQDSSGTYVTLAERE